MSDPESLWLVGRIPNAISFLMIFNPGHISAPAAAAAATAAGAGAAAVVGAEGAVAATTPMTISAAYRVYALYNKGSCNQGGHFNFSLGRRPQPPSNDSPGCNPMQQFIRTKLISTQREQIKTQSCNSIYSGHARAATVAYQLTTFFNWRPGLALLSLFHHSSGQSWAENEQQ